MVLSRVSTIKEQVYRIIKEEILNGDIKPGEKLQEKEIADKLNVSRSPVREAIKELVGEGLVENIPNKGTFVKKLDEKEILDLLDLRMILEQYSLQKAIERASDDDFQILDELYLRLEEFYKKKDVNEYAKTDAELHTAFILLSGNMTIHSLVENIFSLFQPFRIMSLHGKKRFEDSLEEHKLIIEGLKERNYEKAWKSAYKHLTLANEEVLRQIKKTLNNS